MAFLGQEEQIREFQDRFRYIYAAVFLALGLLLSRMVFLQVLKGDQMRRYSEENRIKRVKVVAPRGMIFDRNRKMLIDNRPAFDLEITPQYLRESKQTPEVIALLSKQIHMTPDAIQEELDKGQYQPAFLPVKIKTDLTRDEVAAVESWKIDMPGVEVREEIRRTNIYSDIAAHLLGYIGEVNATELPILNKNGVKYKLGDDIGKFGLEQKLEDTLRGIDGEDIKEVDALGRIKLERGKGRVLSSSATKPALPGKKSDLNDRPGSSAGGDPSFWRQNRSDGRDRSSKRRSSRNAFKAVFRSYRILTRDSGLDLDPASQQREPSPSRQDDSRSLSSWLDFQALHCDRRSSGRFN